MEVEREGDLASYFFWFTTMCVFLHSHSDGLGNGIENQLRQRLRVGNLTAFICSRGALLNDTMALEKSQHGNKESLSTILHNAIQRKRRSDTTNVTYLATTPLNTR